jgi:hypothetical protein
VERVAGSATFPTLIFSHCCHHGKVALDPLPDPPLPIQSLLTDQTSQALDTNFITALAPLYVNRVNRVLEACIHIPGCPTYKVKGYEIRKLSTVIGRGKAHDLKRHLNRQVIG